MNADGFWNGGRVLLILVPVGGTLRQLGTAARRWVSSSVTGPPPAWPPFPGVFLSLATFRGGTFAVRTGRDWAGRQALLLQHREIQKKTVEREYDSWLMVCVRQMSGVRAVDFRDLARPGDCGDRRLSVTPGLLV